VTLVDEVDAGLWIRWIFSFLTANRMQTYCLAEAPSAEAIRAAARRADLPAGVIVEVSRVSADTFR
jgi:hypothetical protein